MRDERSRPLDRRPGGERRRVPDEVIATDTRGEVCGEQARVDWAYVGKVAVSGGQRQLWLFVLEMRYARALWGELVFDLTADGLCRSLTRAATFFVGLPRQWPFDNPEIVVLERNGSSIRFHPALMKLCGQMRVQPRLCAVAQLNTKVVSSVHWVSA